MHFRHKQHDYRHLWTALKVLFGLALVALVVRGIRWEGLRESWQAIWWLPWGLIIGLRFVVIATRAWRWQVLLRHTPSCPTVGQLTRVLVKAELFNSIMPSTAGGDIYRVVATRSACDTPSATAAVLADRALGMIVLVLATLVAVIASPWVRQSRLGQIVIAVAVMAILTVGLLWVGRRHVGKWLQSRAQGEKSGDQKPVIAHILDHARALAAYARRPRQLILALVLSVLPVAAAVVSIYLLCLSVGAVPGPVDLIAVALTITVIAMLPIFVGGLGGWEAAVIFMFQQVGVSSSAAVLIAVLGRAAGTVVALLAGLLYLYDSARSPESWPRESQPGAVVAKGQTTETP